MNPENKIKIEQDNPKKGLEMYFSQSVAENFAELEQNEKNFRVAKIMDRVLMQETSDMQSPIKAVELGGGAHPDRYDEFFNKLLQEPQGHIDWVDISPHMLRLADKYISNEKYQNRKEVINFVQSDILEYLNTQIDNNLDIAIMKYTIDHIANLNELFKSLADKLKKGGKMVASIGSSNPELKSFSTNARFLYNGEQFPDDETRILKDGDTFTVKFFKKSEDSISGYLEGAETTKYFHSSEKIQELAKIHNFDIFFGDWKDLVSQDNQDGEEMNQEMLVLTKR